MDLLIEILKSEGEERLSKKVNEVISFRILKEDRAEIDRILQAFISERVECMRLAMKIRP